MSAGLAHAWMRRVLLWSHKGPVNKIYTLAQSQAQPVVIYRRLDNPAHLTVDSHRGCVSPNINIVGLVAGGMARELGYRRVLGIHSTRCRHKLRANRADGL